VAGGRDVLRGDVGHRTSGAVRYISDIGFHASADQVVLRKLTLDLSVALPDVMVFDFQHGGGEYYDGRKESVRKFEIHAEESRVLPAEQTVDSVNGEDAEHAEELDGSDGVGDYLGVDE